MALTVAVAQPILQAYEGIPPSDTARLLEPATKSVGVMTLAEASKYLLRAFPPITAQESARLLTGV